VATRNLLLQRKQSLLLFLKFIALFFQLPDHLLLALLIVEQLFLLLGFLKLFLSETFLLFVVSD
jgi:hypothetical protein